MVPGLILKLWKIMMMQLPPILSALCWCERKSNLYLLYNKNWNLRVLRWRDLTVSVQISHLTRARFKSCTPGVPFVSNFPLPGYAPLSNTRRLSGRGGGCHRFELNGAFYKRWTQSGVCTTITSSANAPRPIIQRNVFPDGHLNLPIRQLEREKDLNYFM